MEIQTEVGPLGLDFDASKFKTKAGAAKALYKALCKLAKDMGQDSDIEVRLYTPEQSFARGYTTGWQVQWESGPYEWAIGASFQVENYSGGGWYTEPYYSFDLCFTN